jgi:class 3 adenylate cyclase
VFSDDPAARGRSQTRGFLFADLRGYSAFTERHGDQAARELLASYRRLVRKVIASFDGAEIRTEGDSFYVVFDSVAQAVRAGLAILAAVAEPPADGAAHPVPVGIGIHAGEAEDSAEGIVSGAVNMAARICAVAEPGELLVSDTVRALTRSYLEVSFLPRGRRRLKGIAEPVALYRVVAGRAAVTAPRGIPIRSALSRGWLTRVGVPAAVAVAVLALAILGGTVLREGVARQDGGASAGPASSPSITVASPDGSAIDSVAAFPTEAEHDLLAIVDEASQDRCNRAEEGPAYVRTVEPRPEPIKVEFVAGVDCALGGHNAPDQVRIWLLRTPTLGGRADSLRVAPRTIVSQKADAIAAPRGSCTQTVPAREEWSFGGNSGLLACYETVTGDAIVWWTYDDTDVLATATRDDRDMGDLLIWWRAKARFGP